jgi:hypothetical protein
MKKERLMELATLGAQVQVRQLVDAFGVSILDGVRTAAADGMPGERPPAAPPKKRQHWSKLPGNEAKAAKWRRAMARGRKAAARG